MDNGFRISSAAVSERGLSEKRPQNEDSFLEIKQSGIFAVADGVGGAQAGEVASQMAMEILGEAFTNLHNGSDADDVMRTAIERANAAIYQMAHELPQLSSMATTIVALHMAGNIATIGHVGDSRLYRVDREGNLYRETDDHSMVAEEVRAGRMTEEQAENHPSRNIISRALGAEPTVEVDIKTIMVEPGTSFLICSDGITRHVGDQEIKGVLTFGGDPAEICEYLKGLCYERGAEDNLTAVVVKVSGASGEALATPAEFVLVDEEPTIATARTPFENDVSDGDDELLELDTTELTAPEISEKNGSKVEEINAITEHPLISAQEPGIETRPESESEHAVETETTLATDEYAQKTTQDDTFSMFSDAGRYNADAQKTGSLGKIATTLGMLLLGGVIGLVSYHFFIAPKIQQSNLPPQTEMQSGNVPLTAFEESRRIVDKTPADALQKFGADPRDAEDYFLVGRSHLLLGHYTEARNAFIAAKERIAAGDVDPNNAKNIETEIAIEMAVTSDTTIQSILKKGLDDTAKPSANANTNANR